MSNHRIDIEGMDLALITLIICITIYKSIKYIYQCQ